MAVVPSGPSLWPNSFGDQSKGTRAGKGGRIARARVCCPLDLAHIMLSAGLTNAPVGPDVTSLVLTYGCSSGDLRVALVIDPGEL